MSNTKHPRTRLSAERERLRNPYAYSEELEAATPSGDRGVAATVSALRNPYASEQMVTANEVPAPTSDESVRQRCHLDGSQDRFRTIRKVVREFHVDLWRSRHETFPDGVPDDPVGLLDPSIALRRLGYRYDLDEYLGDYEYGSNQGDVAGEIDRHNKMVRVCRRLRPSVRRFTAAHELGHAVMHQQTVMHRDRPIDGSIENDESRSPLEREADVFAAEFLMPPNLLRARFRANFGNTGHFELNWNRAYALDPSHAEDLLRKAPRGWPLAQVLAKAGRYGDTVFDPLAEQFGVSAKAMAYRLLELGLVRR